MAAAEASDLKEEMDLTDLYMPLLSISGLAAKVILSAEIYLFCTGVSEGEVCGGRRRQRQKQAALTVSYMPYPF